MAINTALTVTQKNGQIVPEGTTPTVLSTNVNPAPTGIANAGTAKAIQTTPAAPSSAPTGTMNANGSYTANGVTYTSPEVAKQYGINVGSSSSGVDINTQTAQANQAGVNAGITPGVPTAPNTSPTAAPAGAVPIPGTPGTPAINTATPNPATVNATPFTQGAAAANASGQPAPQTAGGAAAAVQNFSAPAVNAAAASVAQAKSVSNVQNALQNDPGYQQLVADATAAKSTTAQSETLVKQYQDLSNAAGLPALDTQLINMKSVIDGTEDDIRKEVTAAGGYATDSQVLAMASARNKTLIQNYNNLLATKQAAEDHINTMIGLAGQDKQNALAQANEQLNIDSQLENYEQKFIANAQQGYANVINTVGYAGLYAGLAGDPSSVALAEQTLGLAPGQLETLANYKTPLSPMDQADLQLKQQQIADDPQNQAIKLAEAKANINQSNASAAASYASAAKTKSETGVAAPNAPGYDASGQKYTVGSAGQEVSQDLKSQNLIGKNGKVSPDTYAYYESWWTQQGLNNSDFKSFMAPYMDPKDKYL